MGERFIAEDATKTSHLNQVPKFSRDNGNKTVCCVFSLLKPLATWLKSRECGRSLSDRYRIGIGFESAEIESLEPK